jgi:hypothetical protein
LRFGKVKTVRSAKLSRTRTHDQLFYIFFIPYHLRQRPCAGMVRPVKCGCLRRSRLARPFTCDRPTLLCRQRWRPHRHHSPANFKQRRGAPRPSGCRCSAASIPVGQHPVPRGTRVEIRLHRWGHGERDLLRGPGHRFGPGRTAVLFWRGRAHRQPHRGCAQANPGDTSSRPLRI